MTEPNDTNGSTRPISVAELLAKNGNIGSPPVGGRRRRRRGNADAVTVAELTGEIPIVTVDDEPEPEPEPEPEVVEEPEAEVAEEPEAEVVEEPEPEPEPDPVEADYAAHLRQRDAEPAPLIFEPRKRAGVAEEMSPDALLDDDRVEEKPSYLRSASDTLFGGDSVADDMARRARTPGPEDIDLDEPEPEPEPEVEVEREFEPLEGLEPSPTSPLMRGVWIVVQSMIAVAFGAALFVAFDQLWKWNNIVALVLSVLVILGLVVGVRVVRKTEDIASTLIAVAVGALVTLGPLALLQST